MKTKIKAALDALGIKVGDEIPRKTCSSIRSELVGEIPEKWAKFYLAWYAITNDSHGFGPDQIVRTA